MTHNPEYLVNSDADWLARYGEAADFESAEAEAAYDLALEIYHSHLAGDYTGFAADTAE